MNRPLFFSFYVIIALFPWPRDVVNALNATTGTSSNATTSSDSSSRQYYYDPTANDELWPGAFPTPVNSTHVITLNIRTDQFPEETVWHWSQRTGPATFQLVESGTPDEGNALFSYEQQVESDTIYHLKVQ
ncbi:expressed unknown protein (Partial), partial [Seminavis robusta]|eukprot:Sro2381_g325480.1 n/a (130) ;mRNA; r:2-393